MTGLALLLALIVAAWTALTISAWPRTGGTEPGPPRPAGHRLAAAAARRGRPHRHGDPASHIVATTSPGRALDLYLAGAHRARLGTAA